MEHWTWRNEVSPRSRDRILRWQRRLRLLEHLSAKPRSVGLRLRLAALWRVHERQSAALGFTIPLGVFAPGLNIAHYGTITINTRSRVGPNCRLHPQTTLGGSEDGAPTVGRDAYIGPGARLIGAVVLGDNVTVGANAVVTSSFGDNVVVAGVPARVIKEGTEHIWRH